MRPPALLAVLIAVALGLPACGGPSEQEKAQKTVCDARADIGRRASQLQGLTPATATIGGVQAQVNAIQDDLKDIAAARGDLDGERGAQVRAATDRFTARLTAIVADATQSLSLSDAQAKLERAAGDLAGAYSDTLAKIDC